MMDFSSVLDVTLAVIGGISILAVGIATVMVDSTTVSASPKNEPAVEDSSMPKAA